jgi:hypothetical protein
MPLWNTRGGNEMPGRLLVKGVEGEGNLSPGLRPYPQFRIQGFTGAYACRQTRHPNLTARREALTILCLFYTLL